MGLKFPPEAVNNSRPVPSDYFGDNVELDEATIKKLCAERKWSKEKFDKAYKGFAGKFNSQKCFPKHTKTDLNVYLCDRVLFSGVQQGTSASDYFDFEFYQKSFEIRGEFMTQRHRWDIRRLCDDFHSLVLVNNKVRTNKLFTDFLHRDWLDTRTCTFDEFKFFVAKYPRFFSKLFAGYEGKGAEIISVDSNQNLEELFTTLKAKKSLIEEIVTQHEELATFCPDTVNTIRICTFLDIHDVVHILMTSGRFGRVGNVIDNFHGGGYAVTIDPKTGIIISDGMNRIHERVKKHEDTGKTFKGFQYPCWEKVCATAKKMAKLIPQLRHVGWDITINDKCEVTLIEINGAPDVDITQSPDDTGRLHLYQTLLDELQNYKKAEMKLLGYRINNLPDFDSAYNHPSRQNNRLQFAMEKLIPDCASLIDLGCRKEKFVKSITPPHYQNIFPSILKIMMTKKLLSAILMKANSQT